MIRKTILTVDDVPENIAIIHGILADISQVRAATDGNDALVIARKTPLPDLILLDVMMPEIKER